MKLDEIVAWYQKRIGTYDKQQWEKSVEQKILSGIANVTVTNTKLKTEFIDVDLVRGSSFPKAKPKQSLFTVIRLAILRYILLPLYAKWWVQHTSPKLFALLLFLYITQLFNWGVYTFNIHNIGNDSERIVSPSELLIPMALSLILSFIHSQIVATNSLNGVNSKRKQVYSLNGKKRERIRRRKKVTRLRSQEQKEQSKISFETIETIQCSNTNSDSKTLLNDQSKLNTENVQHQLVKQLDLNKNDLHLSHMEDIIDDMENVENLLIEKSNLSSIETVDMKKDVTGSNEMQLENSNSSQKKRSVNWDSPIRNYACDNDYSTSIKSYSNIQLTKNNSGNSRILKKVQIDESVQEFYDNLIQKTEDEISNDNDNVENVQEINAPIIPNVAEQTGEDDGFESLNGKSSSGEENILQHNPIPQYSHNKKDLQLNLDSPSVQQNNNQLRLRTSYKNVRDISNEDILTTRDDITISTKRKSSMVSDHSFRKKVPLTSKMKLQKYSHNSFDTIRDKLSPVYQNERRLDESSDTDEEGDDGETISSPASISNPNYNECTTSATEWFGITTNSEECSYSSEIDNSDELSEERMDYDYTPTVILNPCGSNDRISCTIWDNREIKKAEMSVLDISSCIIERVEAMPETYDYIYIGVVFSMLLSFIPSFCRLCEATVDTENPVEINYLEVSMLLWEKASSSFSTIFGLAFGVTKWERMIRIIGFIQRIFLTFLLFFLLSVAERTFKQRFLYAKLFSHLTSSRRARKSELPHFRLNKVRNIKTWLSVRSYLKRRGPQRSVDVIVSAAFMLTLLLLAFLSVEWLKDSVHLHSQYNLEALFWSTALGIFLLRFMTLGNKINRKYRSISVLITEQINLYLQIEQKPKNKDELMVSNSVLKLAADLLKELESPFKISGLSANPYLYTTIKVVILSALSGALSEMLGFKLKLHKIKIK